MTGSSDREPAVDGESTTTLVEGFDDFQRIGRGASSTVYRARQVRMDRPVAIKVLDADLRTDRDRRVFERECRAMGVLSRHPNIVTVYSDAYTIDGRACLVMELYHGNYRERLDDAGALPLRELLAVGVKVGAALQAAHDTGVLHRDIKPHNVFVSDFGEPALGDFGISTLDDERSITAGTGLSVAYAAPEVVDDGRGDFLSDVYSLSATLFHLAAGHPPFVAAGIQSVMRRILDDDPPPIGRSDVPESLDRLLASGMAKDPGDRPESAETLAHGLRDIQEALGIDPTPIPLRTIDGTATSTSVPRPAVSPPSESARPGDTHTDEPVDDPEATLLRARPPVAPRSGVDRGANVNAGSPPTAPTASGTDATRLPTPELRRRRRLAVDSRFDRSWLVDVAIFLVVIGLIAFALSRM